jgi:hypothetical protein
LWEKKLEKTEVRRPKTCVEDQEWKKGIPKQKKKSTCFYEKAEFFLVILSVLCGRKKWRRPKTDVRSGKTGVGSGSPKQKEKNQLFLWKIIIFFVPLSVPCGRKKWRRPKTEVGRQ